MVTTRSQTNQYNTMVKSTVKPTIKPTIKPTVNSAVKPTSNSAVKPTSNSPIKPTINSPVNPTSNSTVKPTVKPTTRLQMYTTQTIIIFRLHYQTFDPVINFNIGENLAKLNLQNNNENFNVIVDFLKKLVSFNTGNIQQRINALYLIYVLLLNNIWWFEITNSTQKFKQTFIQRLPTDFLTLRENNTHDLHDFANIIVEMSKKLNTKV